MRLRLRWPWWLGTLRFGPSRPRPRLRRGSDVTLETIHSPTRTHAYMHTHTHPPIPQLQHGRPFRRPQDETPCIHPDTRLRHHG
ncbi:hypothetical protein COCMIDRAFT_103174 [Bipolaris oryzae ATCC 44560]|uniref:Uncharacterized protein n=1 Tax=Bipolaris oryzae ATCC 44560 TaxID=930090 RepID=W6YYD9_COCMI|nr:uncharacterized protein COCMIDRAFT_103174 [Bipolaris oryzae ATCC 44560]EUC42588.1 hypothetical protein COCMIDRAFT_103174 [Bipolaris oryzae ATCC 44560]